jgi:hypothetical protein
VHARAAATALAVAAAAAGCGSGGSDAPPPRPDGQAHGSHAVKRASPAICGRLRVSREGAVRAGQATELSGLALSRRRPGVLWTHNDSGDGPRVLGLRADGSLVADVAIAGAQAEDWEDVAVRGDHLYVADIGDNDRERAEVVVYRLREPAPGQTTSAPAEALRLRYPGRPHDAETLLVDPRGGGLALVTKDVSGESGVYVAPRPSATAVTTLRRAGTLHLGLGGLASAGDVSADGRVIAVRTYTGFVAWARRPGDSLARAMRRRPCAGRTSLAREGQGETLALTAHGRAFLTVPEGHDPIIRRYAATR